MQTNFQHYWKLNCSHPADVQSVHRLSYPIPPQHSPPTKKKKEEEGERESIISYRHNQVQSLYVAAADHIWNSGTFNMSVVVLENVCTMQQFWCVGSCLLHYLKTVAFQLKEMGIHCVSFLSQICCPKYSVWVMHKLSLRCACKCMDFVHCCLCYWARKAYFQRADRFLK
jgi:hypothetical protein